MKQVLLFSIGILGFALYGKCQQGNSLEDAIKLVFENDRLKVTEYTSTSGKDMCGKGRHSHSPHLTIFITDALARLTAPDGKMQDFDLKAGTTVWAEAETHMVINNGDKQARVYLIEVK